MMISSKTLRDWFWAVRPLTLIASVAPVTIGTAMAFGDGVGDALSACGALLGAVLIQIGTNLSNDYFDFKKGADTSERIGPQRAIPSGILTPDQVKWGFITAFTLAALVGATLVARAGFPIVVIAVVSILAGLFYTAGSRPLAYRGLGDIFVLVFFGPVAVAGTYYVQSFEWNWAVVLSGLAPGFLSVGILDVNNLRDIDGDRKVGKKTLAVRWGRPFARCEYLFCILAAAFIPVLIYVMLGVNPWILLSSLVAFAAIPVAHDVFTSTDGNVLNRALERTGQILLAYTIIYSITWVI